MIFDSIKNYFEKIKKEKQKKIDRFNNYINSFVDDEIAKKASFLQLKRGGNNIITHKFIIDNNGNFIFKVSIIPYILIIGLPILVLFILFSITSIGDKNNNIYMYINLIFSLLPFLILFVFPFSIFFYFKYKSKIFDFQNGYYYDLRYKKKLYELLNNKKYKNKIFSINQIQALQIIKEFIVLGKYSYNSYEPIVKIIEKMNRKFYYSYELNLILKDSSRINVIDHSSLSEIRKNAKQIANKLGIKVWDIT